MIKRWLGKLRKLLQLPPFLEWKLHTLASKEDIESLKIQNGRIWSEINKVNDEHNVGDIHLTEFKVFSQFGDDGIIQFLIRHLGIKEQTFIEFGVESYSESNTRFLLMNNNWRGLIMDGSERFIHQIKKEDIYWKYDLTAVPVFITTANVNAVIEENGFNGEIGLLHIDIDGNDYWIWKEVTVVNPIVVIVEYNSVLGYENPWTIEYKPEFYRTNAHFSNLYYGASIAALCELADEKGYIFIGCNSNGNNAYFVRKDKAKQLKALSPVEGYVESKFRESRNENGELTFLSAKDRLLSLRGLTMYNVKTDQIDTL